MQTILRVKLNNEILYVFAKKVLVNKPITYIDGKSGNIEPATEDYLPNYILSKIDNGDVGEAIGFIPNITDYMPPFLEYVNTYKDEAKRDCHLFSKSEHKLCILEKVFNVDWTNSTTN